MPVAIRRQRADGAGVSALVRSGGKAVWVGTPPLLRRVNEVTGNPPSLLETGWVAASEFHGVGYGPAIFDVYRARPTPEGRRWGLDGWWLTRWSPAADSSLTQLATDERGDAPSSSGALAGRQARDSSRSGRIRVRYRTR